MTTKIGNLKIEENTTVRKNAFVCELCGNESNFAFQDWLSFYVAETKIVEQMDICSDCLSTLDMEAWQIVRIWKAELNWTKLVN